MSGEQRELVAASGHAVIVKREPDDSVSLSVGRSGVYVLASLTASEALRVARDLIEAYAEIKERETP